MASPHMGFERRVLSAIEAAPSRIPVIVSGCGTGRTDLAQRVRDRVGAHAAQYVDVERCATTPERFAAAVIGTSPFRWPAEPTTPTTARAAFDGLLAFLETKYVAGNW